MVVAPATYVWENPKIDTYPAVDGETGEQPDTPEVPDEPELPDEPEAESSFDENGVAKFEESDAELVCNTLESNYVLSKSWNKRNTTGACRQYVCRRCTLVEVRRGNIFCNI